MHHRLFTEQRTEPTGVRGSQALRTSPIDKLQHLPSFGLFARKSESTFCSSTALCTYRRLVVSLFDPLPPTQTSEGRGSCVRLLPFLSASVRCWQQVRSGRCGIWQSASASSSQKDTQPNCFGNKESIVKGEASIRFSTVDRYFLYYCYFPRPKMAKIKSDRKPRLASRSSFPPRRWDGWRILFCCRRRLASDFVVFWSNKLDREKGHTKKN